MTVQQLQPKCWFNVLAWAALLSAACIVAIPGTARAHSFTVALYAVGNNQQAALASAIRGMRLAARERDGHEDETSDGHLGGLDLFIQPRPASVIHGITWLKGAPQDKADIIVFIGSPDAVTKAIRTSQSEAITIAPGVLPAVTIWFSEDNTPDTFSTTYYTAYGIKPDRQAAEGYNAARRIDLAVRAQSSVADRDILAAALTGTANGIDW